MHVGAVHRAPVDDVGTAAGRITSVLAVQAMIGGAPALGRTVSASVRYNF